MKALIIAIGKNGSRPEGLIKDVIGVLLNASFWSLVSIFVWSLVSAVFYCSRAGLHLWSADKLTSINL